MITNCEFCGKSSDEVGRLKKIRDWETPTCFGDNRKKARIRHLCPTCAKIFEFQSGVGLKISEFE